jgi:prepilin signal peptidase PulO-like enzyme (type II secretory pathway)
MITIIIILISLAFGSFANNIISGFTNDSKYDLVRSTCMCGEKDLKIYELIPILSYLYQFRKCNYCDKIIPWRYLLIELSILIVGLIFLTQLSVAAIIVFLFNYLLICIAVIDLLKYIIPNALIILLLIISLIKVTISRNELMLNTIISITVIALFILINILSNKLKKKDAIGYGDIKLLGVLSFFYGIQVFFFGLWVAALLAVPSFYIVNSVSGKYFKNKRIPFGFFLALAFLSISIVDKQIVSIIQTIIGV